MSTKRRYRAIVWEGLCKHQRAHEAGQGPLWASAASIADRAGVSVVTARKYLNELVSKSKVHALVAGSSTFYMIAFEGGEQ